MAAGLTAVVDYGLCNVDLMVRALEECGAVQVERTRDPRVVDRADRIVLPGVGTFAAAMRQLVEWRLLDAIRAAAARGSVPFLGACLEMQLMAQRGVEGATGEPIDGIGLVAGRCGAPGSSGIIRPDTSHRVERSDSALRLSPFRELSAGLRFLLRSQLSSAAH